jgi:methylthioribose-1-phosphate isomerase
VGIEPVRFLEDRLEIVDQTLLPETIKIRSLGDLREIEEAIRSLRVRGAPLIGIVAAYAVALEARKVSSIPGPEFRKHMGRTLDALRATRPTAVNLSAALTRLNRILEEESDPERATLVLKREALLIHDEERERCRAIAVHGAELFQAGSRALTLCNTGPLATGGDGTALGILVRAHERKTLDQLYVAETRPLLQGSRLTLFELREAGVPAVLIPDSAAGFVMGTHKVTAVVVGADRIARNGDTANKIGTFSLAVLAGFHRIPFYVAAPSSTVDRAIASGSEIPLEERSEEEVLTCAGRRIAPEGGRALNYAFDVTPSDLITAIVTETGVHRPPYARSLDEGS